MVRMVQITVVIFILSLGLFSATKKYYDILSYKCVGCGNCTKVCPKNAVTLELGKAVIDPDKCIGCAQCFAICSFSAIRPYTRK